MSSDANQPRRSELFASPLIFGATSLGNLFRKVPEAEKSAIVRGWVTCGLQPLVIDSAGKYGAGLSLEVIGRELAKLDVSAEDVIISNKLGWRRTPLKTAEPTFEPGAWFGLEHDAVQDISFDGILRCYHEGNGLLGSYRASLVSVHDPDEYLAAAKTSKERTERFADLVEAYRGLQTLKASGEVAGVGVGAKDWTIIRELSGHCDFDWVMFANSFTIMDHPLELSEFMLQLSNRHVSIVNSALFHGGFLLGGDFFDYRRLNPTDPADIQRLRWREKFAKVCEQVGVSRFDAGLCFGKAHPSIASVALSSSRAERIPTHVQSIGRTLPAPFWEQLKRDGLVAEHCDFL